ncbi:MAG: hypothetical protein IKO78_02510 [Bacilli bacterium]|nr:hypothetical protein [Bacilli bacterium]
MLNYKTEVKSLNTKISELEEEKRKLNDLIQIYKLEQNELEQANIKIASLEQILDGANKTSKENLEKIKEINTINEELLTKVFNLELEIKTKNVEVENYKLIIKDYQTEGRYLVKKVKPGRKPNTIKTKISKPMSANVTKYMRGEHE